MTYLILDLETTPDRTRWSAPADKPDAFAPVWAQRIVCAGWASLDRNYALSELGAFVGFKHDDLDFCERVLLLGMSRPIAVKKPTLITFNGRSFDLPVIAHRALLHGVPVPWYYARDVRYRYTEDGHLDLCDALTDYGASSKTTLDALARLIGLPGKVGVDGSDVEALYLAGKLDEIERYCLGDVAQTALLLLRYRLIQGALKQAEYESARDALTEAFRKDARLSDLFGTTSPAIPRDVPIGAPRGDSTPAGACPATGVVTAEVG